MRIEIVLLAGWAAATATAQETEWIEPCAPQSREAARAREAVRAFRARVEREPVDARPDAIERALEALLEERCLAIADELGGRPHFDSVASARDWLERGGGLWLESLTGGDFVVPPDPRPTLSLETSPQHPLQSLLCPIGDEACGRATAGWRLRAELAFSLQTRSERAPTREHIAGERARCLAEARAHPDESTRWLRYTSCMEATVSPQGMLPIGELRAPTRGWWVIRGRRGHYSFCDEVRAYDLATGAAYVTQSCGGLVLRPGGSVDGSATDAARGIRETVGRLPVEALREAAWMALLATEVRAVRPHAERFTVPSELRRRVPAPLHATFGSMSSTLWVSSAQTRLAWAWIVDGTTVAQGNLTWPDSSEPGEWHADELIAIAEAALEPGCAPARLPPNLPLGNVAAGVSSIDADPASRQRVEDALGDRLRALGAGARLCRR